MPPDLFNLLYKMREDEIEEENRRMEDMKNEKSSGDGSNIPMMSKDAIEALGDEFENLLHN